AERWLSEAEIEVAERSRSHRILNPLYLRFEKNRVMKRIVLIIALFSFFVPTESMAQKKSKAKGFDYAAHSKTNKKAQRWKMRRSKAAKGDMTNTQCSVRKTRRAARRAS
ncbi:MAG: hypothetical protein RLZZ262_1834, partial [Bacteroidota bacterium]